MNRVDQAMKALQASFFARAVYFEEHAAVTSELERAGRLLSELLAEQDRLTVFTFEDRLVCEGVALPSGADLLGGLFARLRQLGIEHLTFHRGLQIEELAALLDQVHAAQATILGSAHLRPGNVLRAESGEGSVSSVDAAHRFRGHARVLADIWSSLAGDCALDLTTLGGVVTDICTTVAASHEVLIPLAALKAHDEYTFIHAVNVGILTAAFCEVIALTPEQVQEVTTAALLHDVGKQFVPREILQKTGPLAPEERLLMQRHPVDGARLLLNATGLPEVAPVVAYEHHLGLKLSGYPTVPAGYQPHPASQIVQVADVYDALRSSRPYRAGLALGEAARILRSSAGTQLEPTLVELFLNRVACHTDRENVGPDAADVAAAA